MPHKGENNKDNNFHQLVITSGISISAFKLGDMPHKGENDKDNNIF